LQQPSRKKPVIGLSLQPSSRSPNTLRDASTLLHPEKREAGFYAAAINCAPLVYF
jgi:hypothetical protein